MDKISIRTFVLGLFLMLGAASLAFAQDPTEALEDSLSSLCADIQSLIPPTAMMLVMVSGVLYAGGQFGNAETRARANTWATSCITGAIVGIIISLVAPAVLATIAGVPISCT